MNNTDAKMGLGEVSPHHTGQKERKREAPSDNLDNVYFNYGFIVNVSLNLQSTLWQYVHCYVMPKTHIQ